METMKATVFEAKNRIDIKRKPIPKPIYNEALVRVTLTTVCGTTLCPGGKERMRRLMELVTNHRLNLRPLLTHDFALDKIADAYDIFGNRKNGVLKVAVRPQSRFAA